MLFEAQACGKRSKRGLSWKFGGNGSTVSRGRRYGVPMDRLLPDDTKTTQEFLANLEHELRVPGHSVRLGTADGKHERHLRISRRTCRPDSNPLAGGTADRDGGAADHRPLQR